MKVSDKDGYKHEISINKKCTLEKFESHLLNSFPRIAFDVKAVFVKLGGKLKDGSSNGIVEELKEAEFSGNRKKSTEKK